MNIKNIYINILHIYDYLFDAIVYGDINIIQKISMNIRYYYLFFMDSISMGTYRIIEYI